MHFCRFWHAEYFILFIYSIFGAQVQTRAVGRNFRLMNDAENIDDCATNESQTSVVLR